MTVNPLRNGRVPFRARARLIRLLGEELISSEAMALVELVKNAYDADAQSATVRLIDLSDPARTVIEVIDDGDGMSLDTVLHSWMEPAASHKRRLGPKRRTARGRLPLGEKGVGRFAADKLGAEMEMVTRERGSDEEVVLTVHWHTFDNEGYLDDVESAWIVREPQQFDGSHGTMIRIRRARAEWDSALVQRIRDGLTRLVSPRSEARDFSINIECPEYASLSGPLTNQLLDNAPYRLNGRIDDSGVLFTDGTTVPVDLRQSDAPRFLVDGVWRLPLCGPFSISLNVWDLDTGLHPSTTDRVTRTALRSFSGVSIYRDGFRVMPYGERGDDWLELNQRRVNNPTMRVSNNQIVGYVEITQDHNPDLRDRTSREGLLDTPAFFDLKALVLAALSSLEERRFAERHPRTVTGVEIQQDQSILRLIEDARSQAQNQIEVHMILQEIERVYRETDEQNRSRYEHVARLAGLGLAAERMTVEFARTLAAATVTLRTIINESRVLPSATPLLGHLVELQDQYELLDQQLDLMRPLYDPSSRHPEDLDVRSVVHDVATILGHPLREARITLRVTQDAPLIMHLNRGHLMQVLLSLFDNALYALSNAGSDSDRQLRIHVVSTGADNPAMLIADNGPGVRADERHLIFAPFYAARNGGRGLGLHVVRDILASYNSAIEVIEHGGLLPGANFMIKFDGRRRIRPRNTSPKAEASG